jgi:hypothetical protein
LLFLAAELDSVSAIPGLATGLYLQAIWLYLGQKAVDSTMD